MCFGSSKPPETTAPAVSPVPKPAPLPSPTPTKVESQATAESRRKKLRAMRYGMMSTIKTSPQGLADDNNTGKTKLGE